MNLPGWIDLALIAALLVSVLLGLWRGFVLEAMALAGWVVAYFAAQWLAPQWAPHLPVAESGSQLNFAAAFLAAFLAVLILWGLFSRGVRVLINATPLRALDRVLGAAFGAVRGVVLLLVLAVAVTMTPAAQSPEWHASQGAHWLAMTLQQLKPMLPEAISRHLPPGMAARTVI